MADPLQPAWIWSLAGFLFLIGAFCVAFRRQLIALILGVELMVNAANLALVFYSVRYQDPRGLAVALLVVALAAAEVVVGVSLILVLHRKEGIADTEEARSLAG